MKISREWATPLTIGAFAIMSVTGILMFFHLNSGINKLVHEWAGWVMVAGVIAHVIVNWRTFTRYLTSSRLAQSIIGLGVAALAVSFIPLNGQGGDAPPPVMAMRAITTSPIALVAPLTGKPASALIEELAKNGIVLPNADATLESAIGQDRQMQAKAIGVLFRKA